MTILSLLSIIPASTTVRILHPTDDSTVEIIGKKYAVEQICNALDFCKKEAGLLDSTKEGLLTIII